MSTLAHAGAGQAGSDAQAQQVIAGLEALVRQESPEATDFVFYGLTRSAGGLSRENWSLDASWTVGGQRKSAPLMLMRDASGSLLNTERKREYLVLKALENSAVPSPSVFWIDPDGRYLGAPSVVMERVAGACDYLVLNGERPLTERLELARAFLDLLVVIQQVSWQDSGLGEALGVPADRPGKVELRHWEAEYRRVQIEPHPELDYILNWLEQRVPQAESVVLVHGDFKPGNALVEGQRITAKLDWETAHLGDPLEDLGWITNPVRRREHQIAGQWERTQIVERYRQLTGRIVNEADLTWWNIFSCWKLAVIQLTAVKEFVEGRYHRVFQTPTWLFRPMFQMMESVR